jgi:hydroxymethylbilane synthase
MSYENQELKFILGSRSSILAKRQSEITGHLIQKKLGASISYDSFLTSGDQLKNQPLQNFGGKGLFCKEVDQACVEGKIDIAVHSAKDMANDLDKDLEIVAILQRADPHDVLISKRGWTLDSLPIGAHVGTASLRRQMLLSYFRPDLKLSILRGNVQTRLRKIEEVHFDATILAAAGLQRLGYTDQFGVKLDVHKFIPAVGQGMLALVMRRDHPYKEKIQTLNDSESWICFICERAFLKWLSGNCTTPLGAYAQMKEGVLQICGMLGDEKNKHLVFAQMEGRDPEKVGSDLARILQKKLGS